MIANQRLSAWFVSSVMVLALAAFSCGEAGGKGSAAVRACFVGVRSLGRGSEVIQVSWLHGQSPEVTYVATNRQTWHHVVRDWKRQDYYFIDSDLETDLAQVKCVNPSEERERIIFETKGGQCFSGDLAMSPDCTYVLMMLRGIGLLRWDTEQRELTRLPCNLKDIAWIRHTAGGTAYAVASGALYRLDAQTGETDLVRVDDPQSHIVDISPDGELLMTLGSEGYVVNRLDGQPLEHRYKLAKLTRVFLRQAAGQQSASVTPEGEIVITKHVPNPLSDCPNLVFVGPRQVAYTKIAGWTFTLPKDGLFVYDINTGKETLIVEDTIYYVSRDGGCLETTERP